MGCCRLIGLIVGAVAVLMAVVGMVILVYGTVKMQAISPETIYYGGAATTVNGFPREVNKNNANHVPYCQGGSNSECDNTPQDFVQGFPLSAYNRESGGIVNGMWEIIDCNEFGDWFLNATFYEKMWDSAFDGDRTEAAKDYYTVSQCWRSKDAGLTIVSVFTGVIGLGLIPAVFFAVFCCHKCSACKRCGQPLLSSLALLPVAMALSIVNLAMLANWGNRTSFISTAFPCSTLEEDEYKAAPFNGKIVSEDAPDIVQFAAQPQQCYSDDEGNHNDELISQLLVRWGLAVGGAVLVFLSSVILTTIVVARLSTVKPEKSKAPMETTV